MRARRRARHDCLLEDLTDGESRYCKIWFAARLLGGTLTATAPEAVQEHIVEAAFLSRAQLTGRTVFLPVLYEDYWRERAMGFVTPRYLRVRTMSL